MHTSHPGWTVGVAAVVGCLLLGTTGVAEEQGARATETIIELSQDGGSRIGVSIEDVADNDSVAEGAFIRGVSPDSPAESAGFSEGDVVVEFDGERVRSVRQLTRLVQETPVGRAVGVVVVRDGGRVELEVTPESGGLNLEQEALRFAPDAATRVDSVLRRELGPFADRHSTPRTLGCDCRYTRLDLSARARSAPCGSGWRRSGRVDQEGDAAPPRPRPVSPEHLGGRLRACCAWPASGPQFP